MPHVGLMTFHFAHHYGAQLQAYATMKAIESLDSSCQVIDYRLPHTTRTNQIFKEIHSLRDLVSNAHTLLHHSALSRRYQRFEAFVQEHMNLSEKTYTTFEALDADTPPCDVYVAGSDQIWNPTIYETGDFDPAMMLAFVKEGRRISYAPSLGTSHLSEVHGAKLKEYIAPYTALSAREVRGCELVEEVTGKKATLVLDPTLLLNGDQWRALAPANPYSQPYILCYFISDPSDVLPYVQDLAKKTGYPIIHLAGMRQPVAGAKEVIFDAGTLEFLGLFAHAAYVCTNSFHGAVFSLQFEKTFYASLSPKERAHPEHSRIYSLLSRLGCTNRIVGLPDTAQVDDAMDYSTINANLVETRAQSLQYLKTAIEDKL